MNPSRSSITRQLALALAIILTVLISLSTVFALRSLSDANVAIREEHLASESRLMADQLTTFNTSLLESTQRLAGLFEKRFSSGMTIKPDERVDVVGMQTPALYADDERLNNAFERVDEFKNLTAGVATVFVRDGTEFVRVTTSLTKQDGSRAIGTVLDHNHPAYQRLLQNQSYVGRALLFDRAYMTQYTPVTDGQGQVIAVLFVGFDYTDTQNSQFSALKDFRIGKAGSLAIFDTSGKWLVAPFAAQSADSAPAKLIEHAATPSQGMIWNDGQQDFYSVTAPFTAGGWQVVASMPMAEIQAVTWSLGWQLAIGSLIALVLAVAAVIWLLRRKLQPLGQLVKQAQALGAGDLSARSTIKGNDEISDLAASFNNMGEALASMVARIRSSAQAVSSRAQALSGLSSGAYEGIEQQSGEISSMAGAVEEFSATSLDIADNMRHTERLANDNAKQTDIGSSSMDEASKALEQIARSLDGTSTVINSLGQRSQEIGGIVSVITSIAEQTNLLALNAAIEAARAGEQGRGFAVVADEVRSLAGRTRDATTQISSMIGSIQTETASAISTMEQGQSLMSAGLQLNTRVVDALAQIAEQTRLAGDQFASITTATTEQSSTATALSSNLQSIALANSEQHQVIANLAETARELDGLAGELRDEVGRFQ
ncbi:methyl-accepting chemotaxis protein [Pseudomonas sp. EL_65y_Pfl2_R95]|uniref:methyl-accepting chemotaxis protein n=1 Tax=Pseudomonas sp. EL_65y_Pfl2_R95 TaxID=3088698 RepID=UPI0030D9F017